MSKHEDRITADRVGPPETAIPDSPAQTPAADRHRRTHPLRSRDPPGCARRRRRRSCSRRRLLGHDYWTVGRFEVSTDDAYVQADSTTIAPKVSGYIAAVLVRDNERVKTGQVLARIDDRDFRTRTPAGQGRCRCRARDGGRQAGAARCAAIGHRHGPSHRRGRPGQRRLRRPGPPALRDPGEVRLWQPCRMPSRRPPGSPQPVPPSLGIRPRWPRAQADRLLIAAELAQAQAAARP